MKRCYFECRCGCAEHLFRMTLDEYPEGCCEVYLEPVVVPGLPWWRRLPRAVRYLFGSNLCGYGLFDEVILKNEDLNRLKEFTEEAMEKINGS